MRGGTVLSLHDAICYVERERERETDIQIDRRTERERGVGGGRE